MNSASTEEFTFHPFTADFARDPYSVYSFMRQKCPVYYHAGWEMYLLSTYEDIVTLVGSPVMVRTLDHGLSAEVLAANRRFEDRENTPWLNRYLRVNILDSEGEMHDRLRGLVFRAFTPARINSLSGFIRDTVDRQVARVKAAGEMDFIEDFVAPIPGYVIGRLLGVPEAERPRLRRWSENIVQVFEPDRTREHLRLAEETTAEFVDFLLHLTEKRRLDPGDDLVSELVARENEGQLSRDELITMCLLILTAGHGSTIDAAGNGLLALLQNRKQLQQLVEAPELVRTAVQEMFRYDAPLPFFHRYIADDIYLRGETYSVGTKFGILYGSANRDPAQFENPDIFDIKRNPNRHLAFGAGSHFCLGNHLARLNMETVFTTLLRELPGIHLADDNVEFRTGLVSRGLKSLQVAWS